MLLDGPSWLSLVARWLVRREVEACIVSWRRPLAWNTGSWNEALLDSFLPSSSMVMQVIMANRLARLARIMNPHHPKLTEIYGENMGQEQEGGESKHAVDEE